MFPEAGNQPASLVRSKLWHKRCGSPVSCVLQPAPTTETEVFLAMFDYMDRLFAIVRPRKLLYMAVGELQAWRLAKLVLGF